MSGGDASSLLPRQFEVDTPEVTLIVKTLERDDATVRASPLSLPPSPRPFVSSVRQRLLLESLHRLLALWSLAAGCWLLTKSFSLLIDQLWVNLINSVSDAVRQRTQLGSAGS